MEITRTATADHVELKLKGRLDAIWSDHVGRALADCIREGHHELTLDMAEVNYISSAGIGIVVMYARQLKAIHGRLAVSNASESVRSVFKLSGLSNFLLIETGPAAPPPAAEESSGRIALAQPGMTAEVYDLDPNAALVVDWPGDSAAWLAGGESPSSCTPVEFPGICPF